MKLNHLATPPYSEMKAAFGLVRYYLLRKFREIKNESRINLAEVIELYADIGDTKCFYEDL